MDETSAHRFQGSLLGDGALDPRENPVLIGGIVGLITVWTLLGIRDYADFEALQWWVYVNYDFTPKVNPFTIGPFLAGIVGGYTAGYLTRGIYEHAIANAVKGNLLAGIFFYLTIVLSSMGALVGSGTIGGDPMLIVTLQPLIFIAIPFSLVFMAEGVIAGPAGQYVRRKLLDEEPWPETQEDDAQSTSTVVRASIGAGAIILMLTAATWVILYSFYLFLTP